MNPTEETKRLFDLYGEDIYRYALYRLNEQDDAKDVVQEIFLQALKSWNRFQHRSSDKTWLWTIANNCIHNVYRRRKRKHEVPLELIVESPISEEPEGALDFEMALHSLPIDQQQVFLQRVMHDMSTKETAESLGWSESKVKTTLHRAIQKLKSWLNEEEIKNDV